MHTYELNGAPFVFVHHTCTGRYCCTPLLAAAHAGRRDTNNNSINQINHLRASTSKRHCQHKLNRSHRAKTIIGSTAHAVRGKCW